MANTNIFRVIKTYLDKPQLLKDHMALVGSVSPARAKENDVTLDSDKLITFMLNDLLKANGRSVSELHHEFLDNYEVNTWAENGVDLAFSVTTSNTIEIKLSTDYPVVKTFDGFRIDVDVYERKYSLFSDDADIMVKGFTGIKITDNSIMLERGDDYAQFTYSEVDGEVAMRGEFSEGVLADLGIIEESPKVEREPSMFDANSFYEALVDRRDLVHGVNQILFTANGVEDARKQLAQLPASYGLDLSLYLERFSIEGNGDWHFWVNGCHISEEDMVLGIRFLYLEDGDSSATVNVIKKNENGVYLAQKLVSGVVKTSLELDSVDIHVDEDDAVWVYGYVDGELVVEGYDNYKRDINDFTWMTTNRVYENADGTDEVEDDFHIYNYKVTDKSVELNLGGGAVYTFPCIHAVQDGGYCSFIFPEGVGRLSQSTKGIKFELLIDGEVWSFSRYREEIGG